MPNEYGQLWPEEFEARYGELRAMSTTADNRVASALTRSEYIYFDWPTKSYVRKGR